MPLRLLAATLLAAVLAIGAVGCAAVPRSSRTARQTTGARATDRVEAVADSVARAQIAAGIAPGVSLAVAQDGEVVFARGYGLADVEQAVAARPETAYEIRSVTKQFTAALVMRLVEAGTLSLDAPITTHLPDFPTRGRKVTVRHLLSHTSGLPDYAFRHESTPQWHRLDLLYEEMLDLWAGRPFESEPGDQHSYNNFGYYLLGEIVGRVTGLPWTVTLERDVLRPLGLDHTGACDARQIVPGRARGYERYEGQFVNAPYVSLGVFGGAGALCSTVGDLARWSHLLHSGRVVSPASLAQMTAPTRLAGGDTVPYGFGLELDRIHGRRAVLHGGTRPGFGSYLVHYPDDGLTVVVLMNSGASRAVAPAMEAALSRAAFGADRQPARPSR